MRTKTTIFCALFAMLALGSAQAFPHHSFAAEFDAAKPINLKGTITKVDFVNPHAWLYLNVTEEGKVVNWAIEMGSPNTLIRTGLTRNTVPAGTEVTIEGYRAKDGSATGTATSIRLPDGRRLFAGNAAPIAPHAGERGR